MFNILYFSVFGLVWELVSRSCLCWLDLVMDMDMDMVASGLRHGYAYGCWLMVVYWGARTEGSIVCPRGYVFGVLLTFGVRRL